MKWVTRVGRIIGSRLIDTITIAAFVLLFAGVAMKTDVATAMIVTGALILLDFAKDEVLAGQRRDNA